MNEFRYNVLRTSSSISIMALIGIFGSFAGGYDLENVFLEGRPFPAVFLPVLCIMMEIIGLALAFATHRKETVDPEAGLSSTRLAAYVFGSFSTGMLLFLFIVGYSNFSAMGGGDTGHDANWAFLMVLAYIGIIAQMYLVYKVVRCDSAQPGQKP